MSDFEIAGKTYRTTRLPTMTAMEVTRLYGAALVFIGDVREKTEKEKPGQSTPNNMGRALLLAAGELPAGNQQFVINAVLGVVHRVESGKATPVREPVSGKLMFDDIEPDAIAEMVYRVLDEHNLISFFVDRPSTT